jgi:hypothetical protein
MAVVGDMSGWRRRHTQFRGLRPGLRAMRLVRREPSGEFVECSIETFPRRLGCNR